MSPELVHGDNLMTKQNLYICGQLRTLALHTGLHTAWCGQGALGL